MTILSRLSLSTELAFDAALRFAATILWWAVVIVVGGGALVAATTDVFAAKRQQHAQPRVVVPAQMLDDRYPFLVAAPVSPRVERQGARRSRAQHSPQQRERRVASAPTFITVPTAAGINIEVAPEFAAPATAVIAALVAGGHTPKRIKCRSFAASHVRGSLHFQSKACDVEQGGWGRSPVPKDLMRLAVASAGLRDGCEFGDHGHFDMGPHLPHARVLRNCGRAYADAIAPNRVQRFASTVRSHRQ